jgi:hypothetical protein
MDMWRWRAVNTRVGLALVVAAIAGGASGCGSSGPARDAAGPTPDAAGDSARGSDGAAADRADTRAGDDDARSEAGPPAQDGAPPDLPADGNDARDATDTPIAGDASDARDATSELGDAPGEAGTLPPASCPTSGQILCESFENVLPGKAPSTSPWLALDPGYCGFFSSPPSSILGVQERVVSSGTRALEANTISNQCVLSADLGWPEPELWLRLWLRLDQGGTNQFNVDEVTFFGIGSSPIADDPRVAVGVRGMQGTGFSPCDKAGIEINNTGGSPVTGCLGKAMPTDRWTCFELHVSQQSGTARSELFIDGEQQSFIVPPATVASTTLVNAAPVPLHYLSLSVRQYASGYTVPAYYDDVAVATQRIGCQ